MLEQLKLFFSSPAPEKCEKHIVLGGRIITYVLVRGRRRRLGMSVDARGLRVGAPHGVSLAEIERFVTEHAQWVLRKLDERTAGAAGAFMPIDGARVPILGEHWTLRIGSGNNRLGWQEHSREMLLSCRANANPREVLRSTLRAHALDVFLARAVRFAPLLDQDLPPIALTNAQTRWGSCSSKSGVRLNWRLVHLPYAQIDYVIAHEFAHLTHMDHSPKFWAQVARLYPGYEGPKAQLKRLAALIPAI